MFSQQKEAGGPVFDQFGAGQMVTGKPYSSKKDEFLEKFQRGFFKEPLKPPFLPLLLLAKKFKNHPIRYTKASLTLG